MQAFPQNSMELFYYYSFFVLFVMLFISCTKRSKRIVEIIIVAKSNKVIGQFINKPPVHLEYQNHYKSS